MKTAGETRNHKKRGFPFALVGAVALIAVIVANVVVWNGYRGKQGQVEALKDEIVQVNEQVSQAAAPPSDLESRLKSAEGNLALARQTYPADIDRNDVFDFMLTTANECQVEILPLVWDGMENAGDGQSSYIQKYHTTITGDLSQTSDFITRLHKDKYPTLTITDCTVRRMSASDVTIPEDEIQVSINLSIALYVSG